MLLPVQISSILILAFIHANAEAPPGYVKPAETPDKNPPKYEYGYNIQGEKGTSQGKVETRDGIYALGRYYVQGIDSTHNVQYYADDWGYHPFIEYSNVGPHSKTSTQLLLGVEAVKALASNKFTSNSVQPKQHVTDIINSKLTAKGGNNAATRNQPQQIVVDEPQQQQQQILIQQQQPQQVLIQQQQPQQILVQQQQPQEILVEQQPQQILVEQQQQQPQQILVEQQPQQILVEQQQQAQVPAQQPQEVSSGQQQISLGQLEQSQQQQSDSIVVESAAGRQSSQQQQIVSRQQVAQPQLEQVLLRQEVSYQQPQEVQQRFAQPQLEQVQVAQEISHQVPQEQQQPQALALQSGVSQIQDNLIVSQLKSQQGGNFGGFGSRINLLGRRRPSFNIQIQQSPERLIETTRNLVSGQDVLNINGALNENIETSIETSTARSVGAENLVRVNSVTESNLINEPIVVADYDEKIVSSTENYLNGGQAREQIYSTTANTLETVSSKSFGVTEPSPLLVTPRAVSTNFLAPITAGIQLQGVQVHSAENQLQNVENSQRVESKAQRENYVVEIQKSLPYYLGKFEYEQNLEQGSTKQIQTTGGASENIELGKTLLAFPEQQQQNNVQLKQSENLQIQEQGQQQQQSEDLNLRAQYQQQLQQEQGENSQLQVQLQQQQENEAQYQQQLQQQQGENSQLQVQLQQLQQNEAQYQQQLEKQQGENSQLQVQLQQQQENQAQYQQQFQQQQGENSQLQVQLQQQQENQAQYQQQFQQQQGVNSQLQVQLQRQQLPEPSVRENFVDVDQQQAQGLQQQVAFQHVTSTISPLFVEKIVEKQVPVPLVQTRIVKEPYPVGVPIHVPIQVPITVEKRIPVPVQVEKIVEKPVTVTEIVEKRIHVPQPYPVEKIVERPIHVPVQVTKYIDRPYPVQVPVAQPVPYPVDRIVEKIVKQPYPVPVKVPVQVKVPVTVERIVEKKVPVPQYIEKQVPVERIVEKQVPHYIDRPYPVQVPVPVAQAYVLTLPTKTFQAVQLQAPQLVQSSQKYSVAVRTNNFQQQQGQLKLEQNAFLQGGAASNEYLPPQPSAPQQNLQQNNGYLPPPPPCDQHNSFSSKNVYYTIPADDYIGLLPPKAQENTQDPPRKFRSARSSFNSDVRLEYGFMPPLRPSLEIDEHGNPITREKP